MFRKAEMNESPSLGTPSKRATIRDVARVARVDPSLVSRILNGNPKGSAAPATRQRIFDAAISLGYEPSLAARSLRMSKAFTLGLLLPNISNPVYASIFGGVESRALELGYGVALGTHSEEGGGEATFTRALEQGRVDGLLIASGALRDSSLRLMAQSGRGPIIMVNRRVDGFSSSVVIDDAAGAALATQHLIDLGHKEIAGIFAPTHVDTAERRRAGFLAACQEASVDPTVIEVPGWDEAAGYRATAELLERSRPTALFVSALLMGVGALAAVRDAGLRCPEDVSVVALHENSLAKYTYPGLTTVSMPTYELGIAAVEELLELIDKKTGHHRMLDTKPHLVIRASTARLSKS